jgi:pyridoxamine 5'-phosphate oxidase-like protein
VDRLKPILAPVETTLPRELQEVFDRFITTEYTTIDRRGQPITWPVTPYYAPGDDHVDVTTGLGYPKKADDAAANPKVALLFSDPTGSGVSDPPTVLVQGMAAVDDRDLAANRERYSREALEKLPGSKALLPPAFLRRLFDWYFTRIYIHVRPERIYVWRDGTVTQEPELLDSHLEEVRSGHAEEPVAAQPSPAGGEPVWDERMEQLGELYRSAVVSVVAPDGFPFSARVPVSVDAAARRVRIGSEPVGAPLQPGLACIAAHDHSPEFTWQRNFQVRGDLVEDDRGWTLVPHKLVGGFEVPPTSKLGQYRANMRKSLRFRKTAKRELGRRSG